VPGASPTSPTPSDSADRRAAIGAFVARLGGDLAIAGESVDRIRVRLTRITRAYGLNAAEIVVFPTALLIDTGSRDHGRVHLSSTVGQTLRLDQITAVYGVVNEAEHGVIEPAAGIARLDAIDGMPPRLPRAVRAIGHGVISAGLALLFQPTLNGLIGAALLGVLVGMLKLPDRPTLQLILPVAAAFVVATIVLSTTDTFRQPLHTLIPPLVTLLPGAALTTGTMELAAGQMMSGAGRLVYGAVQLLLLAFGILAAVSMLNDSPASLQQTAVGGFGWWAPWLGVVVCALGYCLHYTAPWPTLPWILLAMIVAYAGQTIGAGVFDAQLSGFFGGLAMMPFVLWIDSTDWGPPSLVTFLPAFWLLVPGAGGLIGVTELVGTNRVVGGENFVSAIVAILSISLGVLIGTAVFRSIATGVHTIATAPPVQRILDAAENWDGLTRP
jgi:uncharacterized membrane protein YjjP (DUF1212 family)/uncharacterized membrane protein YjjB (DUF3815 family)